MASRFLPDFAAAAILAAFMGVCLLGHPGLAASTGKHVVTLQLKERTASSKKGTAFPGGTSTFTPFHGLGLSGRKAMRSKVRVMSEEECMVFIKARPPQPLSPRCQAVKNVNEMLTYIYDKKHYDRFTKFVPYFNSSILKTFVLEWLPLYNVTILAPTNTAYATMDRPTKALIQGTGQYSKEQIADRWLQVIAFHVWFPRNIIFDFNTLGKTKAGDRFTTACYPQKDIWAYRLKTPKTMFNGRVTDLKGATPGKTVYYDGRVKTFPIISVVEVDYIMTPREFY